MLLQATEFTTETAHAAANVTAHANTEPLTALLWLLVLLFGGALVMLLYKLIWKDKPVGQMDLDALRKESDARQEQLTELKTAFAERKASADKDRLSDRLKVEQDFAAVATTLNRLADVADTLTTMTERVGWHGKLLDEYKEKFRELHEELKEVKNDIKELYREGPPRA